MITFFGNPSDFVFIRTVDDRILDHISVHALLLGKFSEGHRVLCKTIIVILCILCKCLAGHKWHGENTL